VFHPDAARRFVFKCADLTTAAYILLNVAFFGVMFAIVGKRNKHAIIAADAIVFLLVPTFVQVFLVARVMREVSRLNKQTEHPTASKPDLSPSCPAETQRLQLSGMECMTSKEARKNQRQLANAVCHVVFWSLLAFGILTFLTVVLVLLRGDSEETDVYRLFKAGMMFVMYVNSSVNFLVFYFAVAEFRRLLRKRLQATLGSSFCGSDDAEGYSTVDVDTPTSNLSRTYPFPERRQQQMDTSQLVLTNETSETEV
jgi:hypothetical protein